MHLHPFSPAFLEAHFQLDKPDIWDSISHPGDLFVWLETGFLLYFTAFQDVEVVKYYQLEASWFWEQGWVMVALFILK